MGPSCDTKKHQWILQRIYREGYPFTASELQAMQVEGLLRHVVQDVYAEAGLPEQPEIRAAAAYALLSRRLRTTATLCGETAAWVHTGCFAPDRVQVRDSATSAAQRSVFTGAWRLHHMRLQADDSQPVGPVRVTTALRTAADLFCGFGVARFPRALDRIPARGRAEALLQHWPAAQEPLAGRDEDLLSLGEPDIETVRQRWERIAALMHHTGAGPDELADTVLGILSRTNWDARRHQRIGELLAQCTSRRLPTVR
ncbi:hypothetical protein [Nesterenkonia ebinurensis]|uniref:hypothetical protein n=1 Tax=Nesterenkonia ebinurensis TaxID=2608252 RepID=UPI00123D4DF8|nr:hypothetical protein [Nesterenkonia ebinurensis]